LFLTKRPSSRGLAAADSTHGANFRRALDQRLAAERARDEYDARHYAAARTVGQATGTGIGLLRLGRLAIVAFPFGLLGRQMARDDNASP